MIGRAFHSSGQWRAVPLDAGLDAPSLKGRFPFRLGTTSYIIPADILPNVEYLAPRVDDVELVLFECGDASNLPGTETIGKLADVKDRTGLSYTVHLPLDTQLGSADEGERQRSVEKCLRTVALTSPLEPLAYVIHLHGEKRGRRPATDLERWKDRLARSIGELLADGLAPHTLCVETLDYPFQLVEPIVSSHDLSICLDVGHILRYDQPLDAYLDRYLDRCRVVHLHGVLDGEDHRDISALSQDQLSTLLARLCAAGTCTEVLTLEVFNQTDLDISLSILEDLLL